MFVCLSALYTLTLTVILAATLQPAHSPTHAQREHPTKGASETSATSHTLGRPQDPAPLP